VRVRNLAAVPHASIKVISLVSTSNDGPTSLQAEPDPGPYMRSNTVMMIVIVHVLWCCLDGNSSSLTAGNCLRGLWKGRPSSCSHAA